ncbi:MAG: hypothetical protein FWD03_06630 [Defluviitaleaceae bacterium]|nr:hypothetical protein [Defluviitaleaceae bacterium]
MMNKCEAEIDAIRLKLYDEIKDLTIEERMKRSSENAQKLAEEFGFTIVSSANNRVARHAG